MKPKIRKKQENLNGNFGAARVQGKRETLDFSKNILYKPGLKIPDPNLGFTRLVEAYNTTDDPKLKLFLKDQLKRRKAATTPPEVKPCERPISEFWEMVSRVR
jgi:hypothetical protein